LFSIYLKQWGLWCPLPLSVVTARRAAKLVVVETLYTDKKLAQNRSTSMEENLISLATFGQLKATPATDQHRHIAQ
jgi:hypothetical protein